MKTCVCVYACTLLTKFLVRFVAETKAVERKAEKLSCNLIR